MTAPTALDALPPSVGDAPVAALLLRDLVAGLAAGTPGQVDPAAVEVTDDGRFHLAASAPTTPADDVARASLAAPELFSGAGPDARSDVYAAACLALTRYLGTAPVAAAATGKRPSAASRLGALGHAQRTVPARLGALPAPFRAVFARAVAKERYLRPTPAALLADLDAAFAASGGEAAARRRVHRLVVLARVFEPGGGPALRAPAAAVPAVAAAAPLHLPIRSLPERLPRRATRAALIAAVTVVATGGVAVAAVVGLSGSDPRPTPQAAATLTAPPTAPSSSAAVATTSAAPVAATSVVPVVATSAAGGNVGGGNANGGASPTGAPPNRSGSGSSNRGPAPAPTSAPSQVAQVPVDPPATTASSEPGTPTDSGSDPATTPPVSSDPPTSPDPTSAPPSVSQPAASTPEKSDASTPDSPPPAVSPSPTS